MKTLLLLLLCGQAQTATPYVSQPAYVLAPTPGLTPPGTKPGWVPFSLWLKPVAPVPGPAGPAGPQGPPGKDATPAAPPIPSGASVDALPALQSLVDAAQKVTDANQNLSLTVPIPQTADYRYLSGPLYLDGRCVTLAGDGPGTTLAGGFGGYGGPPVVVGVSRLERQGLDPKRYRVPSAVDPKRLGLATRGEVYLIATAHPAQLGGGLVPNSVVPDYWTGAAYCWDFVVGTEPGMPAWPDNGSALFGVIDGDSGAAMPWAVRGPQNGHGGLTLWFRTSDQSPGQYRRAYFPTPGVGPWPVCLQWDGAAGTVDVWVGGVAQPVTVDSTDATVWAPGTLMARHDGTVPFTVGMDGAGVAVPVQVHALAVTRGRKYKSGTKTEVRTDGLAVNASRYWENLSGDVQTVFTLPGDDSPATHVRINGNTANGVGFLIPVKGPVASTSLAIRNLRLISRMQESLAVGYVFGLDLTDVDAGSTSPSLRGIGSVPMRSTYPVSMRGCKVGGLDCAYDGFMQIVYSQGLQVLQSGRDGVRCKGGSYTFRDTLFTNALDTTDCYFRTVANGYGGRFVVDGVLVDNEVGSPRVAVLDLEGAPYCVPSVAVRDVNVSQLPCPSFIRLTGFRTAATANLWPVGVLSAENLCCYSGMPAGTAVVTVRGKGSWVGRVDPNGLGTAAVGGDTEGLVVAPLMVPGAAP